jgi:MFS family permease
MLGSGMTRFGLIFWLYGKTGEATSLGLLAFSSFAPTILLSPVAGVMIDRLSRKLVMMLSDLAAALSSIVILILLLNGRLEGWHLYLLSVWSGAFETFQWPAYSASVTTMVEPKHFSRANGLLSFAGSSSMIFSPMIAAFLLASTGIITILIIDIATFLVAISTLIYIQVPHPSRVQASQKVRQGFLSETVFGFKYILSRKSLLGLQLIPLAGNFFSNISMVLIPGMVLARTDNDVLALGTVETALGVGGVVGGLVMGVWGGPKRRIHGALGGWMFYGLLGEILMGIGRTVPIWTMASFFNFFSGPFIDGSAQAIWQRKVPPEVQGKVFATRRMIAHLGSPLAMLFAGFLADRVFAPRMMSEGSWVRYFDWLVGTGSGAGMGLIMVFSGLMTITTGLTGYLIPFIRDVEEILPDHYQAR